MAEKTPIGHDPFWIAPAMIDLARGYFAAEKYFNLMEAGLGVMKFVDQRHSTHRNHQPGFLAYFTDQVIRYRMAGLDPATGCAPKIRNVGAKGIDQQKPVLMHDYGAGSEAGCAGFHAFDSDSRQGTGQGL